MAQTKSTLTHPTRDLLAIAQQLRSVKQAEKQFLMRWAQTCAQDQIQNITSLYEKLNEHTNEPRGETNILDALDHDWSNLYRGSVLDD